MEEKDKIAILLAEDNEGHALLTKDLFKRAGVVNEIIHFRDGQEAWEQISRKAAPAGTRILLLDIRLPKLEGPELLRRIKADPALKAMPVIMLTCSDDPKETALCFSLGCAAYLNKPLVFEEFAQAIGGQGLAIETRGAATEIVAAPASPDFK